MAIGIGTAISAGAGLVGQAIGAIGAEKRSKKMMERQHNYNKEVMDIQNNYLTQQNLQNQKIQQENWENTNAQAQVNQMKQAGLNIGLMYGGSGAGGQTSMGSQSAGAPSGTSGYSDGGLQAQGMNITSRMGQELANIELTKAQTENVKADTEKKKGVDTDLAKTNIEQIKTGIETEKGKQTLQRIEADLNTIEYRINSATEEEKINILKYESKQAFHQMNILANEEKFSTETYNTKVKALTQELALMIANEDKIKADTKVQESIVKYAGIYADAALINAEANRRNSYTNQDQTQIQAFDANTRRKAFNLEKTKHDFDKEMREAGLTNDQIRLVMDGIETLTNGIIPMKHLEGAVGSVKKIFKK